jgi:hypothetical protein
LTGRDGGYLARILVVLVLMPATLIVSGLIVACCLFRHLPDPARAASSWTRPGALIGGCMPGASPLK